MGVSHSDPDITEEGTLDPDLKKRAGTQGRRGDRYLSNGDTASAVRAYQSSIELLLNDLERIKLQGLRPPTSGVILVEEMMKKLHKGRSQLGEPGSTLTPEDVESSATVSHGSIGSDRLKIHSPAGLPLPHDAGAKTCPASTSAERLTAASTGSPQSSQDSDQAWQLSWAGNSSRSPSDAASRVVGDPHGDSRVAAGGGGGIGAASSAASAPAAMVRAPSAQEVVASLTAGERSLVEQVLVDPLPGIKPGTGQGWGLAAGMEFPKRILTEAVVEPLLNPSLFRGIRSPPKGVLLFGPPGTGKTLLARALAAESGAAFLSVSASTLTGKYVGESEKQVRDLFAAARKLAPCIIFIDEIDSLMTTRSSAENDASRRLKTEMLVQMDGIGSTDADGVFVIAATNRPQELDDAMLRRLSRRVLLPLPDAVARKALIGHVLKGEKLGISVSQAADIVRRLDGYSASDIKQVCQQASRGPVDDARAKARAAGQTVAAIDAGSLRSIVAADFDGALRMVRPSVMLATLKQFEDFDRVQGSRG